MARKNHEFNYIYKTVCTITNKFYIGVHSTNDIDDGYMGSGVRISKSIKKYGKNNHVKEIIEYFDDRISLMHKEKEIVNEELLKNPYCMNISIGGTSTGVNYRTEHTQESKKLISEKLKNKSYEEIHGNENAELERVKRKNSVKKYWDCVSDDEKNKRYLKIKGLRYEQKNKEELKECPYCKILARGSLLKRWHFEKCKKYTNNK